MRKRKLCTLALIWRMCNNRNVAEMLRTSSGLTAFCGSPIWIKLGETSTEGFLFMQPIKGYENLYLINKNGEVFSIRRKKMLKPYLSFKFKGLYYYSFVFTSNGNRKNHTLPNPLNLSLVDHINGNTTDNRIENLRWCNRSQNRINSKKTTGKTSKYRGVSWDKQHKKWKVQGRIDGKVVRLGSFNSELEASEIYDKYAKKYHGEFARN